MSAQRARTVRQLGLNALALFAGIVAVTLAGIGLLIWSQNEPPTAIAEGLHAAHPWLSLWRLVLIGVLVGSWPWWATRIAQWRALDTAQYGPLLAARWTIVGWLVVLELVLGQNVVGRFLGLMAG